MPVGGTIAWASTTGRLAAGTSVVAVAGDGKFIAAATANAGAAIRVLLAHPIHRSSQSKVVSQLAPYECRTDCVVKKAPTVWAHSATTAKAAFFSIEFAVDEIEHYVSEVTPRALR
jgi:hypothetical protein